MGKYYEVLESSTKEASLFTKLKKAESYADSIEETVIEVFSENKLLGQVKNESYKYKKIGNEWKLVENE